MSRHEKKIESQGIKHAPFQCEQKATTNEYKGNLAASIQMQETANSLFWNHFHSDF